MTCVYSHNSMAQLWKYFFWILPQVGRNRHSIWNYFCRCCSFTGDLLVGHLIYRHHDWKHAPIDPKWMRNLLHHVNQGGWSSCMYSAGNPLILVPSASQIKSLLLDLTINLPGLFIKWIHILQIPNIVKTLHYMPQRQGSLKLAVLPNCKVRIRLSLLLIIGSREVGL